jgi:hypothetical protein
MSEDNSVALERATVSQSDLSELWTDYKAFRKATLEAEGSLIEAGIQDSKVIASLDADVRKLEQKVRWITVAFFAGLVIALLVPAMF